MRERNAAQHQPKERKEINDKITAALETRTQLGIDTGLHNTAKDVHSLPFRMKAKWLENSNTKIEAKLEHDKRRTLARRCFKEGRAPTWNADADKSKTITKRKTKTTKKADSSITPWSLSSAAAARTLAERARSHSTTAAAGPGRVAAKSRAAETLRASSTSCICRAASACAVARPMPLVAPVSTQTGLGFMMAPLTPVGIRAEG